MQVDSAVVQTSTTAPNAKAMAPSSTGRGGSTPGQEMKLRANSQHAIHDKAADVLERQGISLED